jgi:hypothetical protein
VTVAANGYLWQQKKIATMLVAILLITLLFSWCPEGDLNPHGLAACGF